jgi:predicted CopG family antitoxin
MMITIGSKHILVRNEVYDKLKSRKLPNESFSEVIERLLDTHKNPFECIRQWKNIGF